MAPLVIAVVNLKGGTSKTTTSAFIAHALHEVGLSVLVVDADPQGSALSWAETGGWPMPTVGLPVRTLHSQLQGIVGSRDVVVIDTPPLDQHAGIVASAMRAASYVLIPIAPTPIEIARMAAVRDAMDEVGPLRPDGHAPLAGVVLTRTVANAASTGVWRAELETQGWHVLNAAVGRLEFISQAYGDTVKAAGTPYEYVAIEILDAVHAAQDASALDGVVA